MIQYSSGPERRSGQLIPEKHHYQRPEHHHLSDQESAIRACGKQRTGESVFHRQHNKQTLRPDPTKKIRNAEYRCIPTQPADHVQYEKFLHQI